MLFFCTLQDSSVPFVHAEQQKSWLTGINLIKKLDIKRKYQLELSKMNKFSNSTYSALFAVRVHQHAHYHDSDRNIFRYLLKKFTNLSQNNYKIIYSLLLFLFIRITFRFVA